MISLTIMLAAAARNRELKFENWCLNFWRKVSGSAQFVDCTLNLSHFFYQATSEKTCKISSRVHSCQIWSKKSSQVLLGSQTHLLKMVRMSVFNQPWKLCPSSPIGQASFKAEAEAILKALEYTSIVVFWDSCSTFLWLILQLASCNILLCKIFTSLVQSQNPKHPMIFNIRRHKAML